LRDQPDAARTWLRDVRHEIGLILATRAPRRPLRSHPSDVRASPPSAGEARTGVWRLTILSLALCGRARCSLHPMSEESHRAPNLILEEHADPYREEHVAHGYDAPRKRDDVGKEGEMCFFS